MSEVQIPAGPPFDLVLFDCDSTLSAVEGIDELARSAGLFETIAPLTRAAMDGEKTLEEVYQARMHLLRPSRAAIEWLAELYVQALVPDAIDTIAMLQQVGKDVHIVSGGLLQAILPLASRLGISAGQVHAVPVYWDDAGDYRGFDEQSPLARAQGKAEVCAALLQPGQRAALIGDGGTDLEAAAAGVYVIGYGGVVQRPLMVAKAQHFVLGPSLLDVLPWVLTAAERALLTEARRS